MEKFQTISVSIKFRKKLNQFTVQQCGMWNVCVVRMRAEIISTVHFSSEHQTLSIERLMFLGNQSQIDVDDHH